MIGHRLIFLGPPPGYIKKILVLAASPRARSRPVPQREFRKNFVFFSLLFPQKGLNLSQSVSL
jgi:hypothetical protein